MERGTEYSIGAIPLGGFVKKFPVWWMSPWIPRQMSAEPQPWEIPIKTSLAKVNCNAPRVEYW